METWEKPSSTRHHRTPSFSSTLLDQIYRSIDDDNSPPLEPTRKKKLPHEDLETSQDKLVFHRRSMASDFERSRRTTTTTIPADSVFLRYSNSTSSDSSGLSSSESDSFCNRSKSSASPPPQPKPIRTSAERPSTTKQELGGFLRTKSKALKIYTDLKKAKQPISPGGRLATFLNSLFTTSASTNNPKKSKKNSASAETQSSSSSSSSTTCSSASSFSRSCLSKSTPSSSSGKSKRSVRFCPVNVILDQDSSVYIPCGNNSNNYEAKRYRHVMEEEEENRRVIEAAKDLIRTYQKNKDLLAVTNVEDDGDGDDDDDDAASYASSDLFELENLSAIGIERYQEELPVYETTRLDNSNRAIATSLIV
ncbi:hypothetical protein Bca4012_068826 [Brassica carinata]|uniref:Protein BIG GRAIN 1-like A n=1 Tax=Brassica carinata TaxID=52824 RepID=A0A8X8B0Y5_BRACI|nr:hypothetical protein Bca52824_020964 [Brassica carinata]